MVDPKTTNPGLKDLRKVLENVYRVLLTRSRKGDAPVFSQGIEGVETGGDVSVVCGDDGDRGVGISKYLIIN